MKSALVNAAKDIVIANNAIQIPLSEPFADFARRGSVTVGCTVDDMSSFCRQFIFAKARRAFGASRANYSFSICSGDVCITKSPVEPFKPY